MLYDQLYNGLENKNTTAVATLYDPDMTESNLMFESHDRAPSIEWATSTPPALHTFNTPAVQS